MKFVRSLEGEFSNLDHVVRFYVDEVKLKKKNGWTYDEGGTRQTICFALYAVTTENIKSDHYSPVLVGFFQDLYCIQLWVSGLPNPGFMPCSFLMEFIPVEFRTAAMEKHLNENCTYHSIQENYDEKVNEYLASLRSVQTTEGSDKEPGDVCPDEGRPADA